MKYKYIVVKVSLPDYEEGYVVNIKTCDNPEEALNIKDGEKPSTRKENMKKEIIELVISGRGSDGKLSIWNTYNAITQYFQDAEKEKNTGKFNNNSDRKTRSAWDSAKDTLKDVELSVV